MVTLGFAGCSVGGAPDHPFPGVATLGGVSEDDDGSTGGGDGSRPTTGDDESTSDAPWTTGSNPTGADSSDDGSTTEPACDGECVELCLDGQDDDGDGAVDCDDDDCAGHLACTCDVLPDEGFGVHLLCSDPVTWAQARDTCEAEGMQLVRVRGAAHNTWLADRTQAFVPGSWWMGLSDLDVEGVWTWSDGSPLSYEHWFPGEPNNGVSAPEHCVAFPEHDAYSWNDLECGAARPFICEA